MYKEMISDLKKGFCVYSLMEAEEPPVPFL